MNTYYRSVIFYFHPAQSYLILAKLQWVDHFCCYFYYLLLVYLQNSLGIEIQSNAFDHNSK